MRGVESGKKRLGSCFFLSSAPFDAALLSTWRSFRPRPPPPLIFFPPRRSLLKTTDFQPSSFQVAPCPHPDLAHDPQACPFAHENEKAARRDPRGPAPYCGTPCPDFRKGACRRGAACGFAHGVFETWLHPSRYRTLPCKSWPACDRAVCFFAHSAEEAREGAARSSGGAAASAAAAAPPGSSASPLSFSSSSAHSPPVSSHSGEDEEEELETAFDGLLPRHLLEEEGDEEGGGKLSSSASVVRPSQSLPATSASTALALLLQRQCHRSPSPTAPPLPPSPPMAAAALGGGGAGFDVAAGRPMSQHQRVAVAAEAPSPQQQSLFRSSSVGGLQREPYAAVAAAAAAAAAVRQHQQWNLQQLQQQLPLSPPSCRSRGRGSGSSRGSRGSSGAATPLTPPPFGGNGIGPHRHYQQGSCIGGEAEARLAAALERTNREQEVLATLRSAAAAASAASSSRPSSAAPLQQQQHWTLLQRSASVPEAAAQHFLDAERSQRQRQQLTDDASVAALLARLRLQTEQQPQPRRHYHPQPLPPPLHPSSQSPRTPRIFGRGGGDAASVPSSSLHLPPAGPAPLAPTLGCGQGQQLNQQMQPSADFFDACWIESLVGFKKKTFALFDIKTNNPPPARPDAPTPCFA